MAIDSKRHEANLREIKRAELEAVASFSSTDVLLLTGYWPVMGNSFAVLSQTGKAYAIVPEDEFDLAKATSNAEFFPYKPGTLDELRTLTKSLVEPISRLARQMGLLRGAIGTSDSEGLEATSYHSVTHFRSTVEPLLRTAFPQLSVIAADEVFAWLKARKTPVELAQIRRVCKLASSAFEAAKRAIEVGRREDEVAADIEAVFSRIANSGFERGRGYFFCMSGPNSANAAGAYARTRRRVIEQGDLVMIHANAVGDGYWNDVTRTFIVGEPSDRQRHMQDAIAEARAAALAAIRPGARASEIDSAARQVLARHGYGKEFKHATGHGVGFAAANPHALPRIHPKSPDMLDAGMTFNIEPAIYFDGFGGMRHCDVVACTDSGAEVLTDF